jgi:hypothetical protein
LLYFIKLLKRFEITTLATYNQDKNKETIEGILKLCNGGEMKLNNFISLLEYFKITTIEAYSQDNTKRAIEEILTLCADTNILINHFTNVLDTLRIDVKKNNNIGNLAIEILKKYIKKINEIDNTYYIKVFIVKLLNVINLETLGEASKGIINDIIGIYINILKDNKINNDIYNNNDYKTKMLYFIKEYYEAKKQEQVVKVGDPDLGLLINLYESYIYNGTKQVYVSLDNKILNFLICLSVTINDNNDNIEYISYSVDNDVDDILIASKGNDILAEFFREFLKKMENKNNKIIDLLDALMMKDRGESDIGLMNISNFLRRLKKEEFIKILDILLASLKIINTETYKLTNIILILLEKQIYERNEDNANKEYKEYIEQIKDKFCKILGVIIDRKWMFTMINEKLVQVEGKVYERDQEKLTKTNENVGVENLEEDDLEKEIRNHLELMIELLYRAIEYREKDLKDLEDLKQSLIKYILEIPSRKEYMGIMINKIMSMDVDLDMMIKLLGIEGIKVYMNKIIELVEAKYLITENKEIKNYIKVYKKYLLDERIYENIGEEDIKDLDEEYKLRLMLELYGKYDRNDRYGLISGNKGDKIKIKEIKEKIMFNILGYIKENKTIFDKVMKEKENTKILMCIMSDLIERLKGVEKGNNNGKDYINGIEEVLNGIEVEVITEVMLGIGHVVDKIVEYIISSEYSYKDAIKKEMRKLKKISSLIEYEEIGLGVFEEHAIEENILKNMTELGPYFWKNNKDIQKNIVDITRTMYSKLEQIHNKIEAIKNTLESNNYLTTLDKYKKYKEIEYNKEEYIREFLKIIKRIDVVCAQEMPGKGKENKYEVHMLYDAVRIIAKGFKSCLICRNKQIESVVNYIDAIVCNTDIDKKSKTVFGEEKNKEVAEKEYKIRDDMKVKLKKDLGIEYDEIEIIETLLKIRRIKEENYIDFIRNVSLHISTLNLILKNKGIREVQKNKIDMIKIKFLRKISKPLEEELEKRIGKEEIKIIKETLKKVQLEQYIEDKDVLINKINEHLIQQDPKLRRPKLSVDKSQKENIAKENLEKILKKISAGSLSSSSQDILDQSHFDDKQRILLFKNHTLWENIESNIRALYENYNHRDNKNNHKRKEAIEGFLRNFFSELLGTFENRNFNSINIISFTNEFLNDYFVIHDALEDLETRNKEINKFMTNTISGSYELPVEEGHNYKEISNDGGGNCGFYAFGDALEKNSIDINVDQSTNFVDKDKRMRYLRQLEADFFRNIVNLADFELGGTFYNNLIGNIRHATRTTNLEKSKLMQKVKNHLDNNVSKKALSTKENIFVELNINIKGLLKEYADFIGTDGNWATFLICKY